MPAPYELQVGESFHRRPVSLDFDVLLSAHPAMLNKLFNLQTIQLRQLTKKDMHWTGAAVTLSFEK